MTTIPFDEPPSSRPSPMASPDGSAKWPPNGDSQERAVAQLLRHGVLSHTLGQDFEYKVRTTMVTQRAWQYRCDVFRHGKAVKRAFSPIVVDRTSRLQHVGTELEGTEARRLSLAKEAIGVHFTRCAVLREYLTLASIYSQPPPGPRRRYTRSVLLVGLALLTGYGVWAYTLRTHSRQPPGNPPPAVQQALPPAAARLPVPAPEPVPQPSSNSKTNNDITDELSGAPDVTPPAQTPKRVLLSDLLASGISPEKAAPAARVPTTEAASGLTAPDLQAGDLLLLTGWLHWIARALDSTYQLYVTPSPKSKASGLIAAVPPADPSARSPAMETQLQTVRSFITQRLLRQQKPSPRRSVLRKPIFVQLTGQLSSPDVVLGEPASGKRSEVTARWEVRPVLDVQFATPPASSGRSRPK
jgi:hypothetical protein